jgi:hypothetical protein
MRLFLMGFLLDLLIFHSPEKGKRWVARPPTAFLVIHYLTLLRLNSSATAVSSATMTTTLNMVLKVP